MSDWSVVPEAKPTGSGDWSVVSPESAPAQEEPGYLEALGRGALQGMTFGFGDEIQGALESIFTDKTYEKARDEARQANARAQAAHSTTYGVGELGGGLATAAVPGLGIAEGAGLGTVAAKSALAGGLSGLGSSEATDIGGIAKDVGEGAAFGAAGGALAHGVGKAAGKILGGAEEKATNQAVKGLVAGEGKAPAAGSATTRKLIEHETVPSLINEPVGNTTLAREAYKPAEEIQPLLDAKKAEIGHGLDAIYDKADQASGGVKVSDLIKHYDDKIAELSKSPGNRMLIKAIEDTRDDVTRAWSASQTVPAKDVRAFATTLQERGATNEVNPKLATQVRQELGSTTRDFVNSHVEKTLGPEDRAALEGLNARYSAAATISRALEDRAAKEAGGKVSQVGALQGLLGHGGAVGAGIMALHGNLPGAAAALVLPKALEKLPAVGRFATTQAAHANQVLSQVLEAANRGVPWAQAQIRLLRSTPIGAARLAALAAPTVAAPVDTQAAEAQ